MSAETNIQSFSVCHGFYLCSVPLLACSCSSSSTLSIWPLPTAASSSPLSDALSPIDALSFVPPSFAALISCFRSSRNFMTASKSSSVSALAFSFKRRFFSLRVAQHLFDPFSICHHLCLLLLQLLNLLCQREGWDRWRPSGLSDCSCTPCAQYRASGERHRGESCTSTAGG